MIFYKYHGAGNDFIIIDQRNFSGTLTSSQISFLCQKHIGIGADGLLIIGPSESADFYMHYYNSDGRKSTMCGNGGRCAVLFARQYGIIDSDETSFEAADGLHSATILPDGDIALKMNVEVDFEIKGKAYNINTGSPHYIRFVYNLDSYRVKKEGKIIRNSALYKQEGINVNFVEEMADHIFVRTYERGVEDETLSCGTGVTASAIAFYHKSRYDSSKLIPVKTLGGNFNVQIEVDENKMIQKVWLIGPAKEVFIGEIDI